MSREPEHDDPAFPRWHGRPAYGWVNDPNGLARVDGRYHVFFQHNPASTRHRAIGWGHASSADLVHWRQEPPALRPRAGEWDAYGCWSGCQVDDDGTPTLVYSGVLDDDGASRVLLARGDRDQRAWRPGRQPAAEMPEGAGLTDVRDPFVFTFQGRRYAVQGAGHREGRPSVLLYDCADLTRWRLLGPLLTADDPVAATLTEAHVWECPNLFPLDGRWVLLVSLWRKVGGRLVLDQVRYLVGDLTPGPNGPAFAPTAAGRLDTGPCCYAPQVLLDGDRVLLWAWARELGRPPEEVDRAGWAGSLTFVRQLSLVGEEVCSRPAPELAGLRAGPLQVEPGRPFAAAAFEVAADPGAGPLRLHLLDGPQERVVARWTPARQPVATPRLLVDGSMVEVFDGGPTAHTTRAYPTAAPARWVLHGEAPPGALRAWTLGTA